MIKISVFLVLLGGAFTGPFVFAQVQDSALAGRNYDEAKEAEIIQKARKRLYPGGRDESDLRVQSQLSNPVRKMAPSLNVSADPEASSED